MAIKFLKLLLFILLGLSLGYVLGLVMYFIIIPDPCSYHNKVTSEFFNLFFEMTSTNGYHPEPTFLYFNFFTLIGIGLGLVFYFKKNKKQ